MISVDPKAIPDSYRDFLDWMKKEGEFLEIDDEIDWYLEMGAILRRGAETLSPSPIFNKVKGCPEFRAAEFGMQKSGTRGKPWARLAPFLGLPLDADVMEMQAAYIKHLDTGKVHPPKIVENKDAPCKENIWLGDDIDLEKIPAPLLHMGDAQRMMQTAGMNIVQTPDGKWTNWSINRSSLIDKKTMAGAWQPHQHNGMIFRMWQEKGEEDMPIAIAFGVPPACAVQSTSRIPDWEDEYDYSSKLIDRPIEMVKCEHSDILVPASSEIVIEGKISLTETCLEGPFGEYAGYLITTHHSPKPKHTVTAVTFRNKGILPISSPGMPPDSTQIAIAFFQSVDSVMRLKKAGFPIIDGLQNFESAGHYFVIRVKNNWHELTGWKHDEFVKKIADFIWNDHIGGGFSKLVLVGEDVDPSDPLAVLFALGTRNHPEKGTYIPKDAKMWGLGVEGYHSMEDFHSGGGGLVVYSCIGLEEYTGVPKPSILTFYRNYPKPIIEKVLANWEKWGMRTPDPILQKHASQSTPWVYFNKTGEGETGKGLNL
jgi:4-hydroxy-3-polyprenylbenzoate decarboxylase